MIQSSKGEGYMAEKVSKDRLVFGLILLVLIAAGEIVLHLMHLPAWPAFFIMIFFFVNHLDMKQAPSMLAGGSFGILNIISVKITVGVLMGLGLSQFASVLTYVLIFVFLIVLLGEIIPVLFNNYAFMAFLFTGTYMKTPDPVNPFVLVAIMLVGGGIFIVCIQSIVKFLGKLAAAKAA